MQRKKIEFSQSAVEFALVLPLLLLVILGLMEMGRLVFIYTAVLNASREAARYGAATGTNDAGVKLYRDCDGIKAAAVRVGFLANIKPENVIIKYDSGGDPNNTIDSPSSTVCTPTTNVASGDRIVIRVSVPFAPVVPLVPLNPITVMSTNARTIIGSVSIAGNVPPPPGDTSPHIDSSTSQTTSGSGASLTWSNAGGPTSGGTSVTITGSNLAGATVTFDSTIATCTISGSTTITCTSPAHSAGTVNVTVTVGTQTATFSFTYYNTPTITLSPSSGPASGGTAVGITGSNLTSDMHVTFDGANCTVDTSTVTAACTTVAHAGGNVTVYVDTPGGTATATYTFVPSPVITSITPSQGLITGGTGVLITGQNFINMTGVTFGGVAASCSAVTSTQISCTIPSYPSAGAVNVTVTTVGGSTTYSSFNYVTATVTATWLYSPTPSQTATITPTVTVTSTATATPTVTMTPTNRPTVTGTATNRPTVTSTVTPTPQCSLFTKTVSGDGTNNITVQLTNNNASNPLYITNIVAKWTHFKAMTVPEITSLLFNGTLVTGGSTTNTSSGNTYHYIYTFSDSSGPYVIPASSSQNLIFTFSDAVSLELTGITVTASGCTK